MADLFTCATLQKGDWLVRYSKLHKYSLGCKLDMPYLGDDWRSPGQKWIRTEFGWKPMSEVRRGLCSQIVNQIFHLSPISSRGNSSHSQSTTKRASPPQDDSSSWRMKAKECSRPDHITAQIERSTSQCGAGVVAKKTVSISGDSIPTTSSSATR